MTGSVFEYHDLIEAVVMAVEMRDIHTAHHSLRVSNMTEELCRRLNLPDEEVALYHIAADLHDIGKLGVRDAVLLKRGRLDEGEWAEMREHAAIGGEILGKVERFKTIAEIVRHHHERWDGNGYPDRVSGGRIPFGSRIIAVADSIDAMLSDRSYRGALSPETCRMEIVKNSGKMYDPRAVAAALEDWDGLLKRRKNGLSS